MVAGIVMHRVLAAHVTPLREERHNDHAVVGHARGLVDALRTASKESGPLRQAVQEVW